MASIGMMHHRKAQKQDALVKHGRNYNEALEAVASSLN